MSMKKKTVSFKFKIMSLHNLSFGGLLLKIISQKYYSATTNTFYEDSRNEE